MLARGTPEYRTRHPRVPRHPGWDTLASIVWDLL